MNKNLTFIESSPGNYCVTCGTVAVGTLYKECDGYLYFENEKKAGCWASWILREIADKLDELNKPWDQQVSSDLQKKRSISRAERARRKAVLDEQIQLWARANLKPGMRLKMGGCRDGKGLRVVLSYTPGKRGEGYMDNVECRQVCLWRDRGNVVKESLGQITEHMVNKIQKFQQPDGTWVSLRKLLA